MNNTTENGNSTVFLENFITSLQIAVYSVTIVVGTVGNFLVCLIMFMPKRKKPKLAIELLIGNLAIADFIISAVTLPFTLGWTILNSFPYGVFGCKFSQFLFAEAAAVSNWTIAAISINRYIMAFHQKKGMSKKQSIIMIASIWIAIAVISSPLLFIYQVRMSMELCK